ncbi:hypothetical protein OV208_30200 [Corallococcus sp. bb12-1]|uniref:hypothetical protein n=1 Tax=Corallococcus sp. bb12-1 TaxID=2996784 RepID=UPI00226EEA74|nr:hypothetical protein [Corallococcus sp. bb12-1]MCY1045626.1 hypothetical protein [Corallococcus sp. bb12-1]
MSQRIMHETRHSLRNAAREVLEFVFASELLDPSDCLWMVFPRLGNVPLLDNTTGAFASLCADFPRTIIPLASLLRELASRGTHLVLVTSPGGGAKQLASALGGHLGPLAGQRIRAIEQEPMPTRGLVGARFSLRGGLNLLDDGALWPDQPVTFSVELGHVRDLRMDFEKEYGACP